MAANSSPQWHTFAAGNLWCRLLVHCTLHASMQRLETLITLILCTHSLLASALACFCACLQGEQCATITINITGIAFTPAFDNFTAITPITRTVCWFKPTGDEHATAEVLLSTKGLCDVTAEIKTSELRMQCMLGAEMQQMQRITACLDSQVLKITAWPDSNMPAWDFLSCQIRSKAVILAKQASGSTEARLAETAAGCRPCRALPYSHLLLNVWLLQDNESQVAQGTACNSRLVWLNVHRTSVDPATCCHACRACSRRQHQLHHPPACLHEAGQ